MLNLISILKLSVVILIIAKMKLLGEKFERNSNAGMVSLKMESVEDMWHVYNIACRGDTIRSATFRKVKEETKSGT